MDCFSVSVRLNLFLGANLFRNWGVAHRAGFTPAGVPAAMIERINHEVAEAIPSHRRRSGALGAGDRGGEYQDQLANGE
jgi:hypothetical protein